MWVPPYETITDEELNESIGLLWARWYSITHQLEEEDKQRLIIQGKPLSYWLFRMEEVDKKSKEGLK